MRNNRIPWPNVVTRCAATKLTGAVNCFKGVRPNDNNNDDNNISNNSHAALVERFQLSTRHKLRQLGLYTNTDTPDTAHQLHVEAVGAEVTYTMTETQPSYSGGGKSNRVSNTFKKAMGLPQGAHWRAEPDKEIASLEKHGVCKLVPIASVPTGHKVVSTRRVFKIKVKGTYKGRLLIQGFSHTPGAYTPGVGPELSLNQPTGGETAKRSGEAAPPGDHWSRTRISHKSSAPASSTRSTSWRGSCPRPRKLTWGRPSICFASWAGPQTFPSPTSRASSSFLPSRMPIGATVLTTAGLRHRSS